MTDRRRAAVPIIAVSLAWLLVELLGIASRQQGDTASEVWRAAARLSPALGWALAGLTVAVCGWLPPHLIGGADWRWLLWAVVVCVGVALATWGLVTGGVLHV